MRISSQGCVCDKCGAVLAPLEAIKVIHSKTELGPMHNRVSSDLTYKSKKIHDFCESCYNEYKVLITQWIGEIQ